MNTELDQALRHLHRLYVELSHHSCPYALCERLWYEFNKAGLGDDDLRITIAHVQRINSRREKCFHVPLRFDSFIGNLERFAGLLGEARAELRARDFKAKHSYSEGKASVLRATGRSDTPPVPDGAMTARDALKRIQSEL